MANFQVGAILEGIKTLKDRTLKATFHMNEMPAEQAVNLMRMNQNFGWLIFVPTEQEEVAIPPEPPSDAPHQKSDSQRQRSLYFVWWDKLGRPDDDFDSWKRKKMERVNDIIRERIAEID